MMLCDRRSEYKALLAVSGKLLLVECTRRSDVSASSDKLKLIGHAKCTFEFSTAVVMRFAKTQNRSYDMAR